MKSKIVYVIVLLSGLCFLLSACSEPPEEMGTEDQTPMLLTGKWLVESDGSIMADPQTSGLISYQNQLISISDGSALGHQRRRFHFIQPETGIVVDKVGPMSMSSRVRRSCFAQYLSDEPDFEALVVDPDDPSVFIIVTEDATRSGALSPRCQERYSDTGSTAYPTLLVRVVYQEGRLTMTHVRPLQYSLAFGVGDFPNDGIEAMAFDKARNLYLGLEKDAKGQPRIFSIRITDDFWQTSDFAPVEDPQLLMPNFESGNHPINGMDFVDIHDSHPGVLIAAARNDDQLWIIDLARRIPTKAIDLQFQAPTLAPEGSDCATNELMDNASLEGVAVDRDTIWLVNDPWKRNYLNNLQCLNNQARYEAMAPLLFALPVHHDWFNGYVASEETNH